MGGGKTTGRAAHGCLFARAPRRGCGPAPSAHAILRHTALLEIFIRRPGFWTVLLAAALLAAPACTAAVAADLTIRVENVLPAGGTLRLGLYDAAGYPRDDSNPVAAADVAATPGVTIVTLRNIAPGTYAIQAYQDVNSNDKMDTSWIGLPLEPFGFSRDAKPFLSKPSFDAVKFAVTAEDTMQVIHLQNLTRNSPAEKARDNIRARQRK